MLFAGNREAWLTGGKSAFHCSHHSKCRLLGLPGVETLNFHSRNTAGL